MKIMNLNIKGFRSLKDVVWEPGDLNVIIGPNGSGKSNLLRMLELISISSRGGLGKHVQRSGGMDALVWDGMVDRIQYRLKSSPLESHRDKQRASLTYDVLLRRLGKSSSFQIDNEMLSNFYRVELGEMSEPFKLIERLRQQGVVFDENEKKLVAPPDSFEEEETLLSQISGPFVSNRQIVLYQQNLAAWSIYHNIYVHQDAAIRQPAVARIEKRVEADGQNLISVLHTLYTGDREFKKEINLAMKAAFGDDFDELVFPPAADQKIQLRVRWKTLKREQSAADLSDGTIRFLLLLTILAAPSPPPLIAIDEPAVGLHPSMFPIIAEYAVDAAERCQVFFTTHSPVFLDAFTDTKPTTTITQWANGETTLLKPDDNQLNYWLDQYSLGKLFLSGELEELS